MLLVSVQQCDLWNGYIPTSEEDSPGHFYMILVLSTWNTGHLHKYSQNDTYYSVAILWTEITSPITWNNGCFGCMLANEISLARELSKNEIADLAQTENYSPDASWHMTLNTPTQ